jgi:hypothetical protein
MEWTTLMDPAISKMYGVEEVHLAAFEPVGAATARPCLCLLIPECELQLAARDPDGTPVVIVNRPPLTGTQRHGCASPVRRLPA